MSSPVKGLSWAGRPGRFPRLAGFWSGPKWRFSRLGPIRSSGTARNVRPVVRSGIRSRPPGTTGGVRRCGRTDRGCATPGNCRRRSSGRRNDAPGRCRCEARIQTACRCRACGDNSTLRAEPPPHVSFWKHGLSRHRVISGAQILHPLASNGVRRHARSRPCRSRRFAVGAGSNRWVVRLRPEHPSRGYGETDFACWTLAWRRQVGGADAPLACLDEARRSRAKSGWEAGIRTPITWFRATGPTVERPPSAAVAAGRT